MENIDSIGVLPIDVYLWSAVEASIRLISERVTCTHEDVLTTSVCCATKTDPVRNIVGWLRLDVNFASYSGRIDDGSRTVCQDITSVPSLKRVTSIYQN